VRVSARGYSLVELVVAVTVLLVGVLAVAGTAAPVARLVRWGGAQSAVAALAGAQLESLRAGGCAVISDGAAVRGGRYRLRWTVVPIGSALRLTVVTSYPWGAGMRTDDFETAVGCAR